MDLRLLLLPFLVLADPSCLLQVKQDQQAALSRARSPGEYMHGAGPVIVKKIARHFQRATKGGTATDPCGPKIKGQKMYFAGPGRCSIASADMMYLAHDGRLKAAVKGEKIQMNCDDVMCPIPVIADCYVSPGICKKNEWCWVMEHEKWGAWAMGPLMNGTYGHTPEPEYCESYISAYKEALAKADGNETYIKELNRSLGILCPSSSTVWGGSAWRPIRGQCVPFRQEQQSCVQQQDLAPDFSGTYGPRYKFNAKGVPMERPLACAEHLTCTAPDFFVLPSTCVQKRPKDICYYGPWWDSSDCPRDQMKGVAGLSYDLTVDGLKAAALLFPGEIAWMGSCSYWDRTTDMGKAALQVRQQVYKIAVTLWPYRIFPQGPPSLEELGKMLPDPFEYLVKQKGMTKEEASKACPILAEDPDSKVTDLLSEAGIMAMQPNKVWSIVHFFTFSLIDLEITQSKGLASQALATLLAQNFWCNDCRSFFEVDVIQPFGLPPLGSGLEIARWWHHAHNVASEHVATTRAGHPWIHQLDALKDYQNPFYMPWETAYNMWYVPSSVD